MKKPIRRKDRSPFLPVYTFLRVKMGSWHDTPANQLRKTTRHLLTGSAQWQGDSFDATGRTPRKTHLFTLHPVHNADDSRHLTQPVYVSSHLISNIALKNFFSIHFYYSSFTCIYLTINIKNLYRFLLIRILWYTHK